MIERTTTWDRDLQQFLDRMRDADMPCADFAAEAVAAVTGMDLRVKFRGRLSWVRDNLAEAVSEVLEPRPVAMARAGDVVMIDGNLGVCNAEVSLFMGASEGRTGTTAVPTLSCDKAWTVG